MVNKKFLLGILVLALVFGMMLVGCGGEDGVYIPPPPQPGDTADNPINRVETIDLGNMTSADSGWQQLLDSIHSKGKYINLDLSACTMTGTSFDPDYNVVTGKPRIVSLILPDVATSIPSGTDHNSGAFEYFSLRSISGKSITTIGDYAFSSFTIYLKTASFPEVTAIGEEAFYLCTGLTALDFPKVTTIGKDAFEDCTGLTALAIPKVTSIGKYAFRDTGSKALTITMGTTAPATLGSDIFYNVDSKTVTVKIPNGATGYTPANSPFTGIAATVSNGTTINWANGFRGAGWNGSAFSATSSSIKQGITLIIQQQ